MTQNITKRGVRMITKTVKGQVEADKDIGYLNFLSVQKGVQAIIRIDGCNAMVSIVNPDDGRDPYIIYSDEGFDGITGLYEKEG